MILHNDITYLNLRKIKRFGIWETKTKKSDRIHFFST